MGLRTIPIISAACDPYETSETHFCCDAQFSDMVACVTRPKGPRMRRREFFTFLGTTVLAWPMVVAQAQHRWRIGHILIGTPESFGHVATALETRLADLGYMAGQTITIINQYTVPQPESLEATINALLPGVDLLVVWGTISGVTAKKLTRSLPVVFMSVSFPVELGLVASLPHPGGNMTGITFEAAHETNAKRLQILKEIVPSTTRIAVLGASGDPNVGFAIASLQEASRGLGVTLTLVEMTSADNLSEAFAEMKSMRAEALIVIPGALTYVNRKAIADLAVDHHLPSCHAFAETVAVGGLVSLGPDLVAMTYQGAAYIDKIIRGAKPSELPVQQPTHYELHLNLKTAKALGLTIPDFLLVRADKVIE
jgi:putative tryptophan/tyrosine transport system substrate-binding protein